MKNIHPNANDFQKPKPAFDFDALMTEPELAKLLDTIISNSAFDNYPLYGLIFLFATVEKAVRGGKTARLEDLSATALNKLYSMSPSVEHAIARLTNGIHTAFRQADFSDANLDDAATFIALESVCGQESEKPLSAEFADAASENDDQPGELERLAAQLSDLMHNPLLPENIYNALGDEICQIPDPHTTENVLLNLKSLTEVGE